MSQLGMRLPGSAAKRGGTMNVYTALLLAAVLSLGGATVAVFMAGSRIGPDGKAWEVHPAKGKVQLKGVGGGR